ncbi:D-alanine--D-alanine ligase [Pusillimonas sp. NJUB218]|uniref:D-alanine--D-alanine ligase n=1 Tax=Pusillimonas sp. NJUB218 TaxID=2023230 RepID=UPI000F4B779A|nr:D-alanine--D-alanine ligase [Pusillimonas sp. NJUB218]ROT45916.1 D-alanine--D-alanine ligase [Pusillimonas sp. NJUB218]
MTKAYGRVGVLYGGSSAEREVSLMSGEGVCSALRSAGVDAHLFDTGTRSLQELVVAGFDRVFIALHGRYGEDGTVQGLLELMGVPYTGSGVLASSLAMDKIMTKKIWINVGLPTPGYAVVQHEDELEAAGREVGYPLMVKPPHEGSTLGITKVSDESELLAAYRLAARFDDEVLLEAFVQGRELTVPVLGKGREVRALPAIEIIAPGGNYDYEHKYVSNDTRYECPAPVEKKTTVELIRLAEQAYTALGCEGWGRADFMLDAQGQPWLLEMNTSPGMTSHSLVPMGAKAAGMTYAELCLAILDTASCKVRAPENA